MSYWDVSLVAADVDLSQRVAAAAATEHRSDDPQGWAWQHRWELAAQPGWGDAWASALASNNPAPGRDPAVISDPMILSAVQSIPAT